MGIATSFLSIKDVFETLSKFRKAFNALKSSDFFVKEISVDEIVESFYSYERLPKNKIKLTGKLSPYIPNNHFPTYTPLDTKDVSIEKVGEPRIDGTGRKVQEHKINICTTSLNVPALTLNPIQLNDGSNARILWLYPPESKGLIFPNQKGNKLVPDNLANLFPLSSADKPIPVLVDVDFLVEQYLYRNATIIGKVITAPKEHFEAISQTVNPFLLNFFSNCIRPFGNQDGILAFDIRKPDGKIEIIDHQKSDFKLLYTVQGMVNLPDNAYENLSTEVLLSKYVDFIPDRQGISPMVKTFLDSKESGMGSIITIGDISWQYSSLNKCFGAYITLNAANPVDYQTQLTKLGHHWQLWQKLSCDYIASKYKINSNINTLICTNKSHEKNFSTNGLQMSKSLQATLLNHDPYIRNSIDWLGVSVGKDV